MKDKLMELLNEMVQERNQTNTEIENRILDKTIKGLQVIRKCLEYGKEMEKYFVMVEVPNIPIGRIMNSKIYFVVHRIMPIFALKFSNDDITGSTRIPEGEV